MTKEDVARAVAVTRVLKRPRVLGTMSARRSRPSGCLITFALSLFLLLACAPATAPSAVNAAEKRSAIDARLRALSVNPVIQQAAKYRLAIASSEPEALAIAVAAANEPHQTVREVLAEDVDDVVIVDWLVSFGAMGTWTAFNPRTSETVLIPVTEIAFRREHAPDHTEVYRLRDQTHLMLVQPVVVDGSVVGAVGYIFSETFDETTLDATVDQLT